MAQPASCHPHASAYCHGPDKKPAFKYRVNSGDRSRNVVNSAKMEMPAFAHISRFAPFWRRDEVCCSGTVIARQLVRIE
jgi:hypothetical protein